MSCVDNIVLISRDENLGTYGEDGTKASQPVQFSSSYILPLAILYTQTQTYSPLPEYNLQLNFSLIYRQLWKVHFTYVQRESVQFSDVWYSMNSNLHRTDEATAADGAV